MMRYGQQDVTDDDIQAIVAVCNSDFLTQGPQVPKFETAVAQYVSAKHAVAVNSATAALHISCLALGLTEGDVLWTSPITFPASANCALYCRASIDFVDIDIRTYNICPIALERKLVQAELLGKLPKILVAVHMCGQPCDMASIAKLSKKYGFSVIEDASHAIGARYQSECIGSCTFSDITIFSFHPVKIITTGEGGMAVTNNTEVANKLMLLRSHGITRDPDNFTVGSEGPWYYQQVELGFNYRMNDIQAALGLSQISRLNYYIERRRELASYYNELLEGLPLVLPFQISSCLSSWHLYAIRLNLEILKVTRRQVVEELQSRGIGVNVHYIPVHTHPFYEKLGFCRGDFPIAERYYREALTIPLHVNLTSDDQLFVAAALQEVLN